jgi:hypothetical protein
MPWGIPVSGGCVERAAVLGRYFIAHAQAAYGSMGANSDTAGADHLLGWIKRTQPATFTKRDAHQENRGRFPRADELSAPLTLLEEHHHIRKVEEEPSENGPGRKPSPIYEVNPLVLDGRTASHIAQNAHNRRAAAHSEDSEDCEDGSSAVSGAPVGDADA